jgi:thiamine biosynthesis lipoprotein
MELLRLNHADHSITLSAAPVYLDLGAIGKGYALDEIAPVLASWNIDNALLIAGYSSILGIGSAPEHDGWPVRAGCPEDPPLALHNQALSASGFESRGQHIVDPRSRKLVSPDRRRSWVLAGSAALADALSTAILVMSDEEIDHFCARHPEIAVLLS